MIDLHIHSIHSDGTDSVIEILKKAEELKLEIISITDHNTINAHLELENINVSDYYSGKIIVGAEIKTVYKKVAIEILCYGIDIRKVGKIVRDKRISKEPEKLEYMKRIGRKIGLKFDDVKIDEENIFAADLFGKSIFKYEENKKIIEKYNLGTGWKTFYRFAQTNPDSIFFIDETKELLQP